MFFVAFIQCGVIAGTTMMSPFWHCQVAGLRPKPVLRRVLQEQLDDVLHFGRVRIGAVTHGDAQKTGL